MTQRPHKIGSTAGGAVACPNDSHRRPSLCCPVQQAGWVCCLLLVPIKAVFEIWIEHKHLSGATVWVWRQERRKGKNPVKSLLMRGLSLWVINSNGQRNLLETHCRCSEMFLNIIWNFLGIFDDYGHDRTGRKSNISGRIKKGTIPRIFWI